MNGTIDYVNYKQWSSAQQKEIKIMDGQTDKVIYRADVQWS